MALLLLEGFDKHGAANSNGTSVNALLTAGEWTSAAGASNTIVGPLSATGYAILLGTSGSLTKTLSGNYARLIGGVRFNSSLAGVGGIQFLDGASNQSGISVNIAGTISLRNGSATVGTAVGTSTASVSANSTHHLEWDITFGNSANYQLFLDGVSILSGTGDTTATANSFANGFSLTNPNVTWDDLYLFDTTGSTNNAVLLTSPRIETTFPTSDSAVQFAIGAAALGTTIARTAVTTGPIANLLNLRRFVPSVACTIASISGLPGSTSGTTNLRGVIYADSGGVPGTLMSSGSTITGITANTVVTLPLTTPQSLTAGTAYWLGLMSDTNIVTWQTVDTSAAGYRASATFTSGAPGTAPAMTSGQSTWLWWGNLTGITGNNWYEAAQQPPPGLPSYLFDALNHEDLYNFTPLSVAPATVHAVAVKGFAAKSDSGAKTVSLRVKSGGTDSGGTSTGQAPGTTFGWLGSYFPTDPNTSAPWTGANLDAATSGFKVDS